MVGGRGREEKYLKTAFYFHKVTGHPSANKCRKVLIDR
jgi:hypothetical protein